MLILLGFVLWLVGSRWLAKEVENHRCAINEVIKYHNNLIKYAESGGQDSASMHEMTLASTKVEEILGADNWIVGARVVRNLYNGVPAVPFAIREIHECIGDHLWKKETYRAVELVRNLLVRHVGRRENDIDKLNVALKRPIRCIVTGWRILAAVPLYLLNEIGIINDRSLRTVQRSKLFSFYSLILFIAAVSGPILSYLADREKIDQVFWLIFGS
jgi:hypothetical protein